MKISLQSIKKLFTPGESLSKKTAQGTVWLFALRIVSQLLGLAKTIFLARLLAPNDFGLFGITVLSVSLLETFSQSGFQDALIQKKEDIAPYLDTGWIVQVARGTILASILFLLAPFIALFFRSPESEQILKCVSLTVFIGGLTNIAVVYFSKELQFHKFFLYQISGTVADFLVSVTLALVFHSVWALVFGLLAGTIVRFVASYVVHPYLPRFNFSFSKAKELFSYGKWIFSSNVIGFFITQADSLLVAKIAGITSLGFYQVAYKVPSVLGSEALAGAIFPAYSKIQHDIVKVKEVYLKILKLFSFILMPIAGGIFIMAAEFITLFLGEKWMLSLWPMRILSLAVLVLTIAILSNYMFLALGRPRVGTKWIFVRFLVIIILMYPFMEWWGILGAALVVLIGALVSAIGFSVQAMRMLELGAGSFFKSTVAPFSNTIIMMGVVYGFKSAIVLNFWSFFLYIIVGVMVYGALTYVTDKLFKNSMISLIQETMNLLIA